MERASESKRLISVVETFLTIQGEGPLAGLPTVFVRTGGCDFRCAWCDSLHAVLPEHKGEWADMDADHVFSEVQSLSHGRPLLVTLSGGNPALQPLGELLLVGRGLGYTFALETQGTVAREWFPLLHHLVLSPKPPSSGMPFQARKLMSCVEAARGLPQVTFKFVVFDDADYEFARAVAGGFPDLPVYLQAGTEAMTENHFTEVDGGISMLRGQVLERMDWLARKVIADCWFAARVSCQQHVLMWGAKQGV